LQRLAFRGFWGFKDSGYSSRGRGSGSGSGSGSGRGSGSGSGRGSLVKAQDTKHDPLASSATHRWLSLSKPKSETGRFDPPRRTGSSVTGERETGHFDPPQANNARDSGGHITASQQYCITTTLHHCITTTLHHSKTPILHQSTN
jgi:hypothetical protein